MVQADIQCTESHYAISNLQTVAATGNSIDMIKRNQPTKSPVYRVGCATPTQFAAKELRSLLSRATRQNFVIRTRRQGPRPAPGQPIDGLWVGTTQELGQPVICDPIHDAIDIQTNGLNGIISGSNAPSVLLAVYRYLTELGFRWVRPGRDGELVPQLTWPLRSKVSVREQASYDHRAVCIEGACGWEHVRDMINWMPKLGFNTYFVQFRDGYYFFERWYRHKGNPKAPKHRFNRNDAERFTQHIWKQCQKRGIKIQMVGHGWTCEPFGVIGDGWYKHQGPMPAETKRHLALVDGRRQFFEGVPLNTNLCYSNKKTRQKIVQAVAAYAFEHAHIDAIHLWLADAANNHCECSRCRRYRPADLYIKLLNECDVELTKRALNHRIVFLLYVDLLWPPKVERIINVKRFILMFAPITRTYSQSFAKPKNNQPSRLPPFVRNKLAMPSSIEQNLTALRSWQRQFKGDSFDFDYHLMWDHYRDPGHYELAQLLHADIRGLHNIGLNGLNSCQTQRCFLPTGLLMTVMGQTLWNRQTSFDALACDHYKATFGPDWSKAMRYTQRLSQFFDPPFLRGERGPNWNKKAVANLKKVPGLIESFAPVIESNLQGTDICQTRSWYYLKLHAELCLPLAHSVELTVSGDRTAALAANQHLFDVAQRMEPKVHRVFDVCIFLRTITSPRKWPIQP